MGLSSINTNYTGSSLYSATHGSGSSIYAVIRSAANRATQTVQSSMAEKSAMTVVSEGKNTTIPGAAGLLGRFVDLYA